MTSALRPKRGEGLGRSREDSQGPRGQTGVEPSTEACCWKALRIQPCKSLIKITILSRTRKAVAPCKPVYLRGACFLDCTARFCLFVFKQNKYTLHFPLWWKREGREGEWRSS